MGEFKNRRELRKIRSLEKKGVREDMLVQSKKKVQMDIIAHQGAVWLFSDVGKT
jgi:hypothetical protein